MAKTIELFPPNLREDKNIQAFAEILDRVFSELTEEELNKLFVYAIDSQPEEVLDWLAWQFHIEGYELAQTVEEKRNLVKNAIELHRFKGTRYAVEGVLKTLNLQGEIKEWFEYNGQPYRFKLFMKSIMSDPNLWDKLISLVNEYKNERSWLDSVGIHREFSNNLSVSSAVKKGRKCTISIHFNPSVPDSVLSFEAAFRTARRVSIGVHSPSLPTTSTNFFCGFALRRARKITIGVANG